jgi:hypothetical protein
MRNSGSVLGGAVSVATNYKSSGAGSVNLVTYIVFIAIESSGPIWALLLSQTRHVRRTDGSKVPMSPNMSWKKEFQALWVHVQHRRVSHYLHPRLSYMTDADDTPQTWMMALPSFYSFFFLAIFSTYLATHFSVRARALSSFLARKLPWPTCYRRSQKLTSSSHCRAHNSAVWPLPRQQKALRPGPRILWRCHLGHS